MPEVFRAFPTSLPGVAGTFPGNTSYILSLSALVTFEVLVMAIRNTLSRPDPTWTTIQNTGVLDNAPPLSTTPLDKLRAQQKAFGIKSHSTPTALATRDTTIQVSDGAKIALRIYTPDEKNESLPIVVVYHGGGWVMGDLDTEDGISETEG